MEIHVDLDDKLLDQYRKYVDAKMQFNESFKLCNETLERIYDNLSIRIQSGEMESKRLKIENRSFDDIKVLKIENEDEYSRVGLEFIRSFKERLMRDFKNEIDFLPDKDIDNARLLKTMISCYEDAVLYWQIMSPKFEYFCPDYKKTKNYEKLWNSQLSAFKETTGLPLYDIFTGFTGIRSI